MKRKNFVLFAFVAVLFASFITFSCKKDDDPAPSSTTTVDTKRYNIFTKDYSAFAYSTTVTTTGVVTAVFPTAKTYYIQDRGVNPNGAVAVYNGSATITYNVGDSISVTGQLTEYSGLAEITYPTASSLLASGKTVTPKVLNIGDIGEKYESMLVKIVGGTFDKAGSVLPNVQSGTEKDFSTNFTSGGKSILVFVKKGGGVISGTIPATTVSLIGVVSVYSNAFQILPRINSDLGM